MTSFPLDSIRRTNRRLPLPATATILILSMMATLGGHVIFTSDGDTRPEVASTSSVAAARSTVGELMEINDASELCASVLLT
jgi:hypothetical protein